jgi:hypothetical protein
MLANNLPDCGALALAACWPLCRYFIAPQLSTPGSGAIAWTPFGAALAPTA